MKIDSSNLEFSKKDLNRGIIIPDKFSSELSEDIGFHIGDGYMKRRKDNYGIHYDFVYSGKHPEDLDYFKNVLIPRKESLFNLKRMIIKNPKPNELFLRFHSKVLFLFYRDILVVKESPKTDIKIPEWVFQSLDFQKSFLRGMMDSDGYFKTVKKNYPIIDFHLQSKNLIKGMGKILDNLNISFSSYKREQYDKRTNKVYVKFVVQISGRKNIPRWKDEIGFKNSKHIGRYNRWILGPG